jgi:hypothetical protein
MRNWKQRAWRYGGVLLAYILLTLVMTWPVVTQLSTHLIGYGDDMWVHYWNDWWVKRVLQQGGNLFRTPLLFHPTGVDLTYHNFAWVNIAIWLFIEPLVGGVPAYNLVHLMHIPLCGMSMFLLARRLTRSDMAAFLSGLVFAFWPYRVLDANHPNMISTEGFPLLMLVLLRLFHDRKPIRDGVIVGLLLALIGVMRLQLTILAGIMMAVYLLYTVIWEHERWNWKVVAGLALAGVVALVLMMPVVCPLARQQLADGFSDQIYQVDVEDDKQDVLSWIIPHHKHPLAGLFDQTFKPYTNKEARLVFSAYVGYIVTGLAIVGVSKRRCGGEVTFWLSLGVLSFALALGPYLQFNLTNTGIPLPYQLVGWLPPIQMLRHPHRFSALLAVPMAVLAGYGAMAVKDWLARQRWGKRFAHSATFAALLTVLVLADYWSVPTTMITAAIPSFYATLADEPGDFAIAGLPGDRRHTESYMFYQTLHGRPILGGHVSRLPPEALAFESSVPLLDGMYNGGEINTQLPDVSRQLSLLDQAGFRYLILHKHLVWPGTLTQWRSYLAISPRYEDEDVVVYTTNPVAGEDFSLLYELGKGVGLAKVDLSTEIIGPGATLDIDAVWGTVAPPGTDFQVDVSLVNEAGETEQVERFEISPSWPTKDWPANAVVHGKYSLPIDTWLGGGTYTVTLNLVQQEGEKPVGRAAEVGEVTTVTPKRQFAVPVMDHEVGATFGDDLRLLGYNLESLVDEMHITLYWQALHRMDRSYKFFVHLCDADTGALIAQVDVVPHDWTYPTTWWEVAEVVSDDIAFPLKDVPPGQYRLWIGVYHPDSGARLPISVSSPGFAVEESRLMLPDAVSR